ncbi:MAG TPA: flagellar export chaperone FliS [Syntrophomonadaceae bacterium]|nr:flagellar export chaperone FliS [Syntrophomonadaceae bacterium]
MNMGAHAYNQYQKTTVETVSPGKLLIMLYDGALKNINHAITAIDENDYNSAHNNIIKTQDIIVELMSTLNMDYDISKNLYSLYDFMLSRLIDANIDKDTGKLKELALFVQDLRDTWQKAVQDMSSNPANRLNLANRPQMTNISLKG